VPKDWSAEQATAFALADNRSAELAEWIPEVLSAQLVELAVAGFDVEALGFDVPEPTEVGYETEDVPELPLVAVTKLGDLWKLGDHLLLCGDSTNPEKFETLLGGDLADMVLTDPPWNVNYGAVAKGNAQGYIPRTILNDHLEPAQWQAFVDSFTINFKNFSKPGAAIYCFMGPQEWPVIDASLRSSGFHWSSTIIWAKDRLVLSRKDYHTQYEPIWYGWNEDAARLVPVEDRKQSDLWEEQRPSKSDLHPTTKPVELIVRALQNSSKPKDLVLEPFGGSGSHLIACEQTNRRCRALELDPKYCDVIIQRWEAMTGEKAVLADDSR